VLFEKKGPGSYINTMPRTPKILLQSDIERAIKNTQSNLEASRFLRVHYDTYKKYASMYKDEHSISLFETHKNQSGKGLRKIQKGDKAKYPLQEIIDGNHPEYPSSKLKFRLIREALLEEKCITCDFDEKRITDLTVPLLLDHKDGDITNHKLDNLQLLCYNCYYLTVGNPIGKKHRKLL
jgi:hypothetical protein